MKKSKKIELYNAIMEQVSRVAKKILFNSGNEEQELSQDMIDKICLQIVSMNSIRDVSRNELDSACVNYEELRRNYSIVHYGPVVIEEQYDIKSKLNELLKKLKTIYKFKDWQIECGDLNDVGSIMCDCKFIYYTPYIDIVIADLNENSKVINEFMKEQGYMMIRKCPEKPNGSPVSYAHLVYVPINQKNVRNEVLKKNYYLYHISPSENRSSIEQNGILAKERTGNADIYYPARVYMSYNKEILVREYTKTLSIDHNTETFDVYEVSINDLPPDVKIFYDPLFGAPFVFIESSIDKSIIRRVQTDVSLDDSNEDIFIG